ncbi:MAG: porin [Elusimicrobia bacterium]|nr:porin [Elusimicrobiota bacterium]
MKTAVFLIASLLPTSALATEATSLSRLPVRFGGFVDTYYAYDFQRPPLRDRAFTTQPARHNEFNVNLAFIEAVVSEDRVRGRLALQAGNSVQSNYGGEPRVGTVSGSDLTRHIQEAVVGYRVTDKLWIDGGIYLSHIGLESWISRDNWGYSRLLMSDFSPYYQAGVKASYQWTESFSSQLHVVNGWQNISENNENKALGVQLAFAPTEGWSVTYNNFYGQEVGNRGRFFNNVVLKTPAFGRVQGAAAADYGIQRKLSGGGFSKWYAGALLARWRLTDRLSATGRVERYVDEDQVIVTTGGQGSFRTTAASINLDMALHPQLLWRNELRHFWGENPVYPTRSGFAKTDGFLASSLGLTF